jgi:ComF family protein
MFVTGVTEVHPKLIGNSLKFFIIFMSKNPFSQLADLFYPRLCGGCRRNLYTGETYVCTHCLMQLPFTRYHQMTDNPLERMFRARIPVEGVTALLFFNRGGIARQLLHRVKYYGDTHTAVALGRLLGAALRNSHYARCGAVVPVPLHPSKLRIRGFNQSSLIAQGVHEEMGIPLLADGLQRVVATQTQTRKTREARWDNVATAFAAGAAIKGCLGTVLLIDDVLTTGATLEACARVLLEAGLGVMLATLACSNR